MADLSFFPIRMIYRERLDLHRHEDSHEIFYCAEGSGTQVIEDRNFSMQKGDLFFFPAGMLHLGNGRLNGDCLGWVGNFSDADLGEGGLEDSILHGFLQELTQIARNGQCKIPLSSAGVAKIISSFGGILSEFKRQDPGWKAAAVSWLRLLLLNILRHSNLRFKDERMSRSSESRDRIESLCCRLRENWFDAVDVDFAADQCGMSRSRFHELFKQHTGYPFVVWLNRLRVEKAILDLRENRIGVDWVAQNAGFTSTSHFYRELRRWTGLSPKKIRQNDEVSSILDQPLDG